MKPDLAQQVEHLAQSGKRTGYIKPIANLPATLWVYLIPSNEPSASITEKFTIAHLLGGPVERAL